MKLEQQVCSLENAKRLKELGVKQESLFYWTEYKDGAEVDYRLEQKLIPPSTCSAFTVAELGEMLPWAIDDEWYLSSQKLEREKKWECFYSDLEGSNIMNSSISQANTEADARAKMLIYLLENKLI